MASLLTTVWLVLGALAFAAILEHAGFLQRLLEPIVTRARTRGRLILAVNTSGVGLNVVAGDQYVADVLPAVERAHGRPPHGPLADIRRPRRGVRGIPLDVGRLERSVRRNVAG